MSENQELSIQQGNGDNGARNYAGFLTPGPTLEDLRSGVDEGLLSATNKWGFEIQMFSGTHNHKTANRVMMKDTVNEFLQLTQKETKLKLGDISDGYHSFNELYDHRNLLFIALCKYQNECWRSKLHHDGTMFDGWYVMGLNTYEGRMTYHLPIRTWELTNFATTFDRAPEHDGHTSHDVLKRLIDFILR